MFRGLVWINRLIQAIQKKFRSKVSFRRALIELVVRRYFGKDRMFYKLRFIFKYRMKIWARFFSRFSE